MNNDYNVTQANVDLNVATTGERKSVNISGIFAIILSLIPVIVYVSCFFGSSGSTSEDGTGAVWWLLVIYYWTVGIPIFIASVILGLIGLKNPNKQPAQISFFIHLAKIIMFFALAMLS